jgi:hypothetical protein
VVDISEGATIAIPDSGDRYVSLMVVNQGRLSQLGRDVASSQGAGKLD